jgi:hypothetical protein
MVAVIAPFEAFTAEKEGIFPVPFALNPILGFELVHE